MTAVDITYRSDGRMKISKMVLIAVLLLGSNAYVTAQAQPFYQGQSIKIIVGFTSGG